LSTKLLPELGGKLWSLFWYPTNIQWLWHNPNFSLKNVQLGANYDDHWAGGWEELFPNDAPGEFMDRNLPDHGEWWSQPWQWEIIEQSSTKVCVRMRYDGIITRTSCEKWVTLENGMAQLSVRYRIQNLEPKPLHFLFKQHLAVSVTPTHRLELPGGKVIPVDLGFSTRIGAEGPFNWPIARDKDGNAVDLSVLPPSELGHREFVYISDLPEGWCGVGDTQNGASLRLHFPRNVFPYTWLFMTFGGWRGLYTVVLEPCTNMPKDLNTAFRQGQCAALNPEDVLDCVVRVELS